MSTRITLFWTGVCGAVLIFEAQPRAGQLGAAAGWGQMAMPPVQSRTRFTAVAAGWLHNLALEPGGTIAAWGDNEEGQCSVPAGLSGVTAVGAGGEFSMALKSDGTVVAWGSNAVGQAAVPPGLGPVVAISAGWDHALALESDGTVVAWGDNTSGQAAVPAGLGGVTAVSAGGYHSLALSPTAQLWRGATTISASAACRRT